MEKDELKARCQSLSNEELFAIIHNKIRFTEKIVTAAQIEIESRRLSKEEEKGYHRQQDQRSDLITGNISEDLPVGEKILFFVLVFIPFLSRVANRDYRKAGHVLKIRQAAYYSLMSLASLTLLLIAGVFNISIELFLISWLLTFFPAYFFDIYYNRQRIIRKLSRRAASREEKEKNIPAFVEEKG